MDEKSSEDFFEEVLKKANQELNHDHYGEALQEAWDAEQSSLEGAAFGCAIPFAVFGILLLLGWIFGG